LIGRRSIQDSVFPIAHLKATTPEKIVAAIPRAVWLTLLALSQYVQPFRFPNSTWNREFRVEREHRAPRVRLALPEASANLNGSPVADCPAEASSRASSSGAVRSR